MRLTSTDLKLINGTGLEVAGDLKVDTQTLFVDASENKVGINRSVPTAPLDVSGEVKISGDLTIDTNTLKVDSTNNRVGILDATPAVSLDIGSATDAIHVPSGTTAQRPTGANGMFRYNSTDNQFEGYADGAWGAIAGSGGGTAPIINTMTGDGSDTTFTLTQNPASENNTQIFIDGVYQRKDSYSVSGTTLTFDAAPANGTAIEVMMFTQTDINTLPASFVSGLTEVTAASTDHMMIFDATDNALKKALVSDVIETVGSNPTFTTATVTGDLTVDTSTLKVDSTNNRVGIGETAPDTKLHIKNAGDADLKLENTSAGQTLRVDQNSIRTLTNSDIFIFCNDDSDNGVHLDASERTFFIRGGTNIAARYGRVNSMVTIGTSYVNVYDFANLGNISGGKGRGMYMVTVCRESGSVGTHAHFIVGVSTGSNSYLYKVLQNSGFVSPQISGSNLQLKISSGSVDCHVTVQPLGVHGAAS